MINASDQYYSILCDELHSHLLNTPLIHADETPFEVIADGRKPGRSSYMWVYRTGACDPDHPVVICDYQPTRRTDHPEEFLKDYNGILMTDSYQVYHSLEKKRKGLQIAGCWVHAKRGFATLVKAAGSEQAIRPFTLGSKNWVNIFSEQGAEASSVLYSIVETAKANQLRVFDYLEYTLDQLVKHADDTDRTFLQDLLPWSDYVQEHFHSPK